MNPNSEMVVGSNLWMPDFSWTKGKEPHQKYHDFHCRNPWIGLLPEDLRWIFHCIAVASWWSPKCRAEGRTGKNGHRSKSLEWGHFGLELEWNVRLFYIGTHHFNLAPKPKLSNYINMIKHDRMKFVFVNLNSIILYLYLFNLIFLYVLIVYNKKLPGIFF